MAKKSRDDEICSLFIFDHTVLKREEDDLKDAILYFFPRSVSADNQCALVGKIIGISDFMMETLPKSPPRIIKLQTEKFAMKRTGCYSIGLASNLSVADNFLVAHLDFVWNTFTFFQGGLSAVKKRHQKRAFLSELEKIWNFYMPVCHFYGDILSQAFQLLPSISLTKSDGNIFLHASHILQRCHKQDGVLGGALLYMSKVMCTQLSPDLTKRLLLLKPQQTHFPCITHKVDFDMPNSVRLLTVFLSDNEYKQISWRRTSSLKDSSSQNRKRRSLDISQLDNDVFIQDGMNLTTLPTVYCKTAVTETSPIFFEGNSPNVSEHQASSSLFHDESSMNVTESSQMLNSHSAYISNISKDEQISDKNLANFPPLKGHSSEQGETFRTVNGLSKSLTKHSFLEQYPMFQGSEDQTESHDQNEGRILTNQNECFPSSNEVLPSHVPITVDNALDSTNTDLNSSSVDAHTMSSSSVDAHTMISSSVDAHTQSSSSADAHTQSSSSVDAHTPSSSSVDAHTLLDDIKAGDQDALEVDKHKEQVDPSLDKSEQANLEKECKQAIDSSKPERNCENILADSEIYTNPGDSKANVDEELKTEEIINNECDSDNVLAKTYEKDSTEACMHTSCSDRTTSDNDSNAAPALTVVEHTHQSPNTSGSTSSHSPSSKDNSFDDKCMISGGSLTSLSEERVSSYKESLHFPLSPEPHTLSVESVSFSNHKAERSLPAATSSETSSEIPHSSDSYVNSSQSDVNGEEWVPAADGLVDLVLYIQGHSDTLLLLLLDKDCRCDSTLLRNLWKFSLPNLAELDFEVKECMEQQTQEQIQPVTENYSYLRNDSFSKSVTGNVLDSVTGLSHEFAGTATKIHHSFQESDTLTDVLFCSHKACVYAHRSVNHETFFQMNNPQHSTGGYPMPKDLTFTLDQVAKKKLQADHDISLL